MHNAACMTDRTKRVRKDVRDGRNEGSARLQRYAHASEKKNFFTTTELRITKSTRRKRFIELEKI